MRFTFLEYGRMGQKAEEQNNFTVRASTCLEREMTVESSGKKLMYKLKGLLLFILLQVGKIIHVTRSQRGIKVSREDDGNRKTQGDLDLS